MCLKKYLSTNLWFQGAVHKSVPFQPQLKGERKLYSGKLSWKKFTFAKMVNEDRGPIFLRQFRLYVLSFMFRCMFAKIWEKSKHQDSPYVYHKHNMKWNRDLQFLGCLGSQGSREKSSFNLCKFGMLSINMNHNIGFFQWKNAMLRFMFDYMTWIIT